MLRLITLPTMPQVTGVTTRERPAPLPLGWHEHRDAKSGVLYYWNEWTREVRPYYTQPPPGPPPPSAARGNIARERWHLAGEYAWRTARGGDEEGASTFSSRRASSSEQAPRPPPPGPPPPGPPPSGPPPPGQPPPGQPPPGLAPTAAAAVGKSPRITKVEKPLWSGGKHSTQVWVNPASPRTTTPRDSSARESRASKASPRDSRASIGLGQSATGNL